MNTVRRVLAFGWPFIKPYRGRLVLGLVLGIFFGLFNATFVWGTKTLFERLEADRPSLEQKAWSADSEWEQRLHQLNERITAAVDDWLPLAGRKLDWRQIAGGLLFLPVLVVLRSGIGYFSVYFLGWVSEYAVRDIRMAAHRRLQSFSIDYFHGRQIGDHTMLINRGAGGLHRCLTYGIADAVKEPFTILSVVGALFLLDSQLALFGMAFAPLSANPIILVGRKLRKVAKAPPSTDACTWARVSATRYQCSKVSVAATPGAMVTGGRSR